MNVKQKSTDLVIHKPHTIPVWISGLMVDTFSLLDFPIEYNQQYIIKCDFKLLWQQHYTTIVYYAVGSHPIVVGPPSDKPCRIFIGINGIVLHVVAKIM